MKKGWEILSFDNSISRVPSTRKIPKKDFLKEGKYPIVSQEVDLINGYWNIEEDLFRVTKPIVLFGDHTKIIKYIDFDFVKGADGIKLFLPIDKLDSKFFAYQLDSIKLENLGYARHYKLLINKQIIVPPLAEQKQIVAILDKAFTAIDKAKANIEKNIANTQELFQSKLNEIFSQKGPGWEEKKLGEVCHVLNGFAFKSKEAIESSNTQLLRMGNLYQNQLDLSRKPVFYPESYSETYGEYLLKESDLIMSLTGTVDKTDYGYTVSIPKTDIKLLLNQRIMKIEVNDENQLNKSYLLSFLQSPQFLKTLYSTASGTRQANLSSRKILELRINIPKDIEVQKKTVSELTSIKNGIQNLQELYSNKLNSLEELKKSLLEKAFSGELTS